MSRGDRSSCFDSMSGTHIIDLNKLGFDGYDQLIVSLPWSYDEDPYTKHPVVYLCDAYWDFELVWAIYNKLRFDKVVPEYILVGLGYSCPMQEVEGLRKKDLSPPSMGSDYLQRIQQKLIPFIERKYPADPTERYLAGVSIGGLFALESLFSAPGLFQGVIALSVNPEEYSRWIFESEATYYAKNKECVEGLFRKKKSLAARAFMAVGELDQSNLLRSSVQFNALLDERNYRFFEKEFRIVDGEKHGGVFAEGMNRGLRFVFGNR